MKSRKPPKRPYDASRRQEQALVTRDRIGASARKLFAERGYAATSIEQIADDAGVAVQTVYATYKTKRAVLFALLDVMNDQSRVDDLRQALYPEQDARRQIALIVRFCIEFHIVHGDVIQTAQSARSSEPDLNDLWTEGEERRRLGQRPVVQAWARRGLLKPGLTATAAADILWTLTSVDCQRSLVTDRGWPVRKFERWLEETLSALLLR